MGLRYDAVALLSQLSRPRYGRELYFAGTELPAPRRVRVATRHGDVRCLVYAGSRPGRYVHLHGGAFVTRYPQMDDFWARFAVAGSGLEVVLPDYDVAPQARFPVAHDQMLDVVVVTAERDTLRREGDRYAARLADTGVPTEHVVAPGVDHYFLHGAGRQQARDLMSRMCDWIARAAA